MPCLSGSAQPASHRAPAQPTPVKLHGVLRRIRQALTRQRLAVYPQLPVGARLPTPAALVRGHRPAQPRQRDNTAQPTVRQREGRNRPWAQPRYSTIRPCPIGYLPLQQASLLSRSPRCASQMLSAARVWLPRSPATASGLPSGLPHLRQDSHPKVDSQRMRSSTPRRCRRGSEDQRRSSRQRRHPPLLGETVCK